MKNFLLALKVAGISLIVNPIIPVQAADKNSYSGSAFYSSEARQQEATPYIVGPGDTLLIELLGIPELSGNFSIGPDGTIYLPRVRSLLVEGLTIDELRFFLTEQFKVYIRDPQVFITPVAYRAVRVYVGGEVSRPGYYYLSGYDIDRSLDRTETEAMKQPDDIRKLQGVNSLPNRWPTLFDALRAAQGISQFSDLMKVKVIRKQPLSKGGGKIKADINFLRLITESDEGVNIRLFDGDIVNVGRSNSVLREQLLLASKSNLSPDFIEVYVSGRVKDPKPLTIPQGASLNQAIAGAGGLSLLRGNVEFLRFLPDGSTDRRIFSYKASAKSGTPSIILDPF